ncbi:MAG: hypothetical protein KF897_14860 [Opitutaceae bacterium]|nr:hypothetical protein [Opitutaceae bacterium]
MNVVAKIWKALMNPAEDPGEALARLLIAANEDTAFRNQVLAVLRVPTAQRTSLINTALHEMRLRGESEAACAAFATLATEEGAKVALRVLGEN